MDSSPAPTPCAGTVSTGWLSVPSKLPSESCGTKRYGLTTTLAGESILYVALLEGKRVALLGLGIPAQSNEYRDRMIGWTTPHRAWRLCYLANNMRYHGSVKRIFVRPLRRNALRLLSSPEHLPISRTKEARVPVKALHKKDIQSLMDDLSRMERVIRMLKPQQKNPCLDGQVRNAVDVLLANDGQRLLQDKDQIRLDHLKRILGKDPRHRGEGRFL